MPGYRRLDIYIKIANRILTTKDKGIFSVHNLRTQAFLLGPKISLLPLWYYHDFNLPVNINQ